MPKIAAEPFDLMILGLIGLAVTLIGRRMADPAFIAAICFGS